ncbi:hypothetical protein GQ457_16G020100 [Hibiscus cannabinus]
MYSHLGAKGKSTIHVHTPQCSPLWSFYQKDRKGRITLSSEFTGWTTLIFYKNVVYLIGFHFLGFGMEPDTLCCWSEDNVGHYSSF